MDDKDIFAVDASRAAGFENDLLTRVWCYGLEHFETLLARTSSRPSPCSTHRHSLAGTQSDHGFITTTGVELRCLSQDEKSGKVPHPNLKVTVLRVEIPQVSSDENASENVFIFGFGPGRGARKTLLVSYQKPHLCRSSVGV